MSKALATIATQPLIVAKVGLQSRPPPARKGKPFKTFGEVMKFIIDNEGPAALFKGIGPQITKGLLVQGLLMMTKERYVKPISCFLLQPLTLFLEWSFCSSSYSHISLSFGNQSCRRPRALLLSRLRLACLQPWNRFKCSNDAFVSDLHPEHSRSGTLFYGLSPACRFPHSHAIFFLSRFLSAFYFRTNPGE